MSRYGKIFKHIKIDDVKRKHRDSIIAEKIRIKKIEKFVSEVVVEVEKAKSDWRKELSEAQLKESDWTITTSPNQMGNSVGATFQHTPSGNTIRVSSGLGGVDAHSTAPVTIDWGFGETSQVAPPTYNQLPLAGLPMPVSAADPMARRNNAKKAEEINKQLDASEKVAEKARADALMKARVTVTGDGNPANIKDLNERAKLVKERIEAVKKWKDEQEKLTKQHQPALNKWYAAREADAKSRANTVISTASKLGWKGPVTFDVLKNSTYQVAKNNTLIVIERQGSWGEWDDINQKDEMNIRVIRPYVNPDTGVEEKIVLHKHDKPVNASNVISSKYSGGAYSGTFQADVTVTGIEPSDYDDNEIRALKDIPEPEPPQGKFKIPKSFEKNMMMGDWSPITKESEDYLNKLKIPFSKSITGVKFAGQLALRLASGDLRPITKSPGFAYNNIAKDIVGRAVTNALANNIIDSGGQTENYPSYYNPKTGVGQVMHDAYDNLPGNNKIVDAVVRGSIGRFTFRSKPDGLEIHDIFDLTKVTSVGGLELGSIFTKLMGFGSVQTIANKLTAIAMQRGAEAGFDMKDSEDQDIWSIFADDVDEKTSPTDLHTPKGFNIDVTFTIPWGQVPSELRSQLGGKEVNKRGRTVKPHRLDAYGGVDKLYDKKKKKVTESRVFDKIKKDFSYKGKPSPDGFPDTPPPKLKNGWHPEYGNKDSSYNRLDPISAKSMPKTGNKKIDAKVEKAKKKTK